MNGWIAMTRDPPFMSHGLAELDYVVDLIEHDIPLPGALVKPDILLTSQRNNHSIIVDCKSETITPDQTERYLKAQENPDSILHEISLSGAIDATKYSAEACYSSFSNLATKFGFLSDIAFPFVHFSHTTSGVFIRNPVPFENDSLAGSFPVNMNPDKELPTEYYPFDIEHEEDYQEFVSALIQSLIYNAANDSELDVEEALKDAHPYWGHISDEKRRRTLEEAQKVMRKLSSKDVDHSIDKIATSENRYIVHHRTASALQKKLSDPDFIKDVAAVIDQERLDSDEFETNAAESDD